MNAIITDTRGARKRPGRREEFIRILRTASEPEWLTRRRGKHQAKPDELINPTV
jgi:hypothetical protein